MTGEKEDLNNGEVIFRIRGNVVSMDTTDVEQQICSTFAALPLISCYSFASWKVLAELTIALEDTSPVIQLAEG